MKEIGINKKLYDRRIELGYSLREASIRLDISKFKLTRIENGYKKVKDKQLQERFIFKYKLEKDFFESNKLDYPTPVDEGIEEDISDSKGVKLFSKLWFKIASLALSFGFIALLVVGLARDANPDYSQFFDEKYNTALNYALEEGVEHMAIETNTSAMLLCSYNSIQSKDTSGVDEFDRVSLNFFTRYDEYRGYTFFNGHAVIDVKKMTGLDFGEVDVLYESRMTDMKERLHFTVYSGFEKVVHFSADFDYSTYKFTYNLIEIANVNGEMVRESSDSFIASVFRRVFEGKLYNFEQAKERFITRMNPVLHYSSLEEFNTQQVVGLLSSNRYFTNNTVMTICGVVFSTLFFALFVLSIIVTTTFGKKVIKVVTVEIDNSSGTVKTDKPFKDLPKNRWPTPIIPEALIRVVAFVLMVVGSMSLYYIFNSIINGDIIGTFESLDHRATVASFTTIGMILIFFIKLDIIQNKKSTFLLNYVLFFAGFIFYVLTALISNAMSMSPALERFKIILDFLPGNIVWGILAFNMLTANLLSKPKFKNNVKRNTILYRLSALLPLGYMIASSLIQIGKKTWGWELPFAVSSLFFTKALIITAFTILYCVVIFVYRRIVDRKFGKENADVYVRGNRYQFIKNLLICAVFALLGVVDMVLGKNPACSKLGFGTNTGIFFLIPLVLLYHPHMGARNKKWDLVFTVAYGFSMLIGIICIISSIGVYITSL